MTAAFIVILAVLSVAALAFYFSTFKSDDCKFKLAPALCVGIVVFSPNLNSCKNVSIANNSHTFLFLASFTAIMIFDGKFQVTRGDVFTTGLKYNHTSVYQQKVDYYRNLITDSLEHNGLTVYKSDIHGFGTGPLVQVDFRVFLDMRKVPR